ncbi:MAG: hypothetical protein ACYDDQ_01750 [Vulcanimicrobiaceae bacterium]
MTAYEMLAERVGPDRLNAFAAEHGIAQDDPGWVGALQMLPLLDAIRTERKAIEDAYRELPARISDAIQAFVMPMAALDEALTLTERAVSRLHARLGPR